MDNAQKCADSFNHTKLSCSESPPAGRTCPGTSFREFASMIGSGTGISHPLSNRFQNALVDFWVR